MTISTIMRLALRFMFPSKPEAAIADKTSSNKSPAKKSVFAAMICVAFSVIPLIVVLVFSDSMIKGMTDRIVELSSFHLQSIQYKAQADIFGNIEQLKEQAAELEKLNGVEAAYIERTGMALAAGKKERSGASVRAVEPKLFAENASFKNLFEVKSGALAFDGERSAVIGSALAEKTGLAVGDTLHLITMRNLPNGKVVPKTAAFTVSGIVSSGYQELDALWVFVPLEAGFEFLASNVSRVFIGIKTKDAFSKNLYAVQNDCQKTAGKGYGVYTWQELNRSTYETFNTTKTMLLFIMFLIVLVASVNVSSALIMLTMEKRKEIAILKAIGASPKEIRLTFVLTGFFTGLGGVIIGLPLGILCAIKSNEIISFFEKIVNIFAYLGYTVSHVGAGSSAEGFISVRLLDPEFYLTNIPIAVPFAEIFAIAAVTLLLSIVVSLIPAYKAANEKPLESLRKI